MDQFDVTHKDGKYIVYDDEGICLLVYYYKTNVCYLQEGWIRKHELEFFKDFLNIRVKELFPAPYAQHKSTKDLREMLGV